MKRFKNLFKIIFVLLTLESRFPTNDIPSIDSTVPTLSRVIGNIGLIRGFTFKIASPPPLGKKPLKNSICISLT